MKNFNFLVLLFVALFCSVTLTSCLTGDDDEDTSENCYEKLQLIANQYQDVAMKFAQNPTSSGCTAWKEAATKLYNQAKQCGDQQMIDYANLGLQQLKEINCSDY